MWLSGLLAFMLGIEKASQVSRELTAIEVKPSATYKASLLKGLKRISSLSPQVTRNYLVYSGDYFEFSDEITALKYDQVSEIFSESI